MIKPKSHYIVLTPSGNEALNLQADKKPATKYTMGQFTGKELKQHLDSLTAIQVSNMRLFEIKDELLMKPETTITVTSKSGEKKNVRRK